MNRPTPVFVALIALSFAAQTFADDSMQDGAIVSSQVHPGCEKIDARSCLDLAIDAMGGYRRLADIHSVNYDSIGYVELADQSPRQYPFLTAYERDEVTVDFDGQRLVRHEHLIWPESDPHTENVDVTMIIDPQGARCRGTQGAMPCELLGLDSAEDALTMVPERLLLQARAATDLHYGVSQWLRATPHTALAFTWHGQQVQVLLNAYTHLPDALERTRLFRDFWLSWGDVRQRVYFDNWRLVQGVVLPTTYVEQRNGIELGSTQIFNPVFNGAIDNEASAKASNGRTGDTAPPLWNSPFSDKQHVELAPGIELYQGAWNTTLIKQDDGVLVLEAPISSTFVKAVLAKAHSEYPASPIKGVISTSDSWPHIAGVRQAVADNLPVYVLDLNRPLLDALVAAPHSLRADDLQTHPAPPHWVTVGHQMELGQGPNRAILYPLRGALTERQYMVYFPQYRLLYASDTLAINPDKTLFFPEMMHEVAQAVAREHLQVDTVFAMHEGPTSWAWVKKQITSASVAGEHPVPHDPSPE
ncbi:MBL fold metallo-hydrolase [Dyella mobilis]|uniref:MBL fold metallo-hydrolase n=1 Tax=Dyella mobilis TaxID=1849582 RepID=A0ABS2KCW3_9GAMM|nr:MBL fold metallo-hydrolase [Dyella mobilis]MBM7129009.1 MBL fold metallo-hydrolase [Dyella mobilis]GLQ99295.1 hypothetical protein GCM10007863_37150 [Dyella mobilis]